MRIPLNARTQSRLAQLTANVQAAQSVLNVTLAAVLDTADVDGASVASYEVDGADLVLIMKDAPMPADVA